MDPQQAVRFAKKYLEDILSFFGLNTEIASSLVEDTIELKVPSSHLNGFLIGVGGDTLKSLQFLISTTLRNKGYIEGRVNVDVADYKAQRADRLVKKIESQLEVILASGQEVELEPMNPAERRIVHQAVSAHEGLETRSIGEGSQRHIIISKKPSQS